MSYHHEPVLLQEVLEHLNIHPGATVIDCTIGGGGHAGAMLEAIGLNGRILGIDRDRTAIDAVQGKFASTIAEKRLVLVHDRFDNLEQRAKECDFVAVDAVLFDLGASSYHFDTMARGFSFTHDAPLDMRFDQSTGTTAADIINSEKEGDLEKIFRNFGEERLARVIASTIVRMRRTRRITHTVDLAELIAAIYHGKRVHDRHIHPATRVFQALRIAVNDEFGALERALPQALRLMKSGGRLGLITFHSLEDRLVKQFFRSAVRGCICPVLFPVCRCGRKPELTMVTRKGIRATPEEVEKNPRARSATLRVAEKI
ncbi:16S rRNA (cytosine(1402)-N(4))-methyltransferase RsmH [Candidatus Uhrbacteria bacterium]|nr:16S rRNA (cytosine(1402)-N(4))-methyltransferase RsmH [Candidatus Uhrbacteria bacterium]